MSNFSMALKKHGAGNIILLSDTLSGNHTGNFINFFYWRRFFNYLTKKKENDIIKLSYANYHNFDDKYYYKYIPNVVFREIQPPNLINDSLKDDILILNGNSKLNIDNLAFRLSNLIYNGLNLIICCPTGQIKELGNIEIINFENKILNNYLTEYYWTSYGFNRSFYHENFIVRGLCNLDSSSLGLDWNIVMSDVQWIPPESDIIYNASSASSFSVVYDNFIQKGVIKINGT